MALDRVFDYRIPERLAGRVQVGSVVRVTLHGRRMRGFVVALCDRPSVPDPRPLGALVSPQPLHSPQTVALARWVADRYLTTWGAVLHQATPGRFSAPGLPAPPQSPPPAGRRRRVVLQVGGPGQVAAAAARAAGDGPALVIAARRALAQEVATHLPDCVILDGDLPPARRAEAWARLRDGHARLGVGGRAALFVPLPALSAVVVAGAHDEALKAERAPRLHGLVVAARRAEAEGASFVAVSPTPPLDLAGPGGPRWVSAGPPLEVRPEVVTPPAGRPSPRLVDALRQALASGRDAVVFSARRGLALRVRCADCGWFPRCGSCRVGMTLFGGAQRRMACRMCGASGPVPSACPDCGGARLGAAGWGTERVAATLGALLGDTPVLRLEAEVPLDPRRPRPAVVVGTRAAAWALEPGSAAAVCVWDLDQLLGLPDFRAAERAAQVLWELSRLLAGGGRFVIQTREPQHRVVQAFTRRSFRYFVSRELPARRAGGYPPFGAVVRADLDAGGLPELRRALRPAGGEVIGPIERGGRASVVVRAAAVEPLLGPLRAFVTAHPAVRVDVDPVDVL